MHSAKPTQNTSYYTQPNSVQTRKNVQDRFTENTTVMGISAGKEPGTREPTPVYVHQPYQRGKGVEDESS